MVNSDQHFHWGCQLKSLNLHVIFIARMTFFGTLKFVNWGKELWSFTGNCWTLLTNADFLLHASCNPLPKKLNKNCFTANYFILFHEKVCKGCRRSRLQLPQVPNPAEINWKVFQLQDVILSAKTCHKKRKYYI